MRGGLTIEGVVQMSFKRTESYPRERSPSLLTVVIVIVAIITLLDKLMTAIDRIFFKIREHRRDVGSPSSRQTGANRDTRSSKTEKAQAKSRTGTLASDRTAF